jgi:hypothetical protein
MSPQSRFRQEALPAVVPDHQPFAPGSLSRGKKDHGGAFAGRTGLDSALSAIS